MLEIVILGIIMVSYGTAKTPRRDIYSPLWAPLLIAEVLVNIGLITAWVYIAFLFFKKKAAFPKWYIGIWSFTPVFDPDTSKDLIRLFITALIWVPYILVSKRVKATFAK